MPTRILLVDDDQAVRSSLRPLLEKEQDFCVVGEAGDALEAVQQTRALSPDLILMDLAMPRQAAAECGADAFLPKTTGLAAHAPADRKRKRVRRRFRVRGRFYFFLGIATRFILRVMQTWGQEFKSDRRMRLTDALDT